ncbi:alpha/beta hydrolase [Streptomyces sp. NPDC047061]|uniref:alpha/beta fold hydrolase n=1 Tax=Streptomyces sp. NPDC047061 TaxID=3154605 RepID=UPI0033CE0228
MKYYAAPGEDRRLDTASRKTLRGSFAELSDGVTQYELSGPEQGDVAVFVGGLTVPLPFWDGLASELRAKGLRTLVLSLYGRGYSDRPKARYDEALFVRQLAELTDRLGLTRPLHVVGTSMGALIAMAYTNRYPERVSTLTLIDTAGLRDRPPLPRWVLGSDLLTSFVARRSGRRLLDGHLGSEVRDPAKGAELAVMLRDASRCEGSLHAVFDTLQHFPLHRRAGLFRHTSASGVPTMLLWGAEDHVTPIEQFDQARTLLKPLESHVIDACGHMPPFEHPGVVADRISAFVETHSERLEA